jgi:hypothetical protein
VTIRRQWTVHTHFHQGAPEALCRKLVKNAKDTTQRPCGQPRNGMRHRFYECEECAHVRLYSLEDVERHERKVHGKR